MLWLTPAADGARMFTTGTPLGATSTVGCRLPGAPGSAMTWAEAMSAHNIAQATATAAATAYFSAGPTPPAAPATRHFACSRTTMKTPRTRLKMTR